MKIVMLTPFFMPHTGGTEKYVRDVATELSHRGHTLRIITTDLPKGKRPRQETLDGLEVIRLPAVDVLYLPIVRSLPFSLFEGFDLIHSHGPAFHFTARAIAYGKVPHVVTFHCDTTVSGRLFRVTVPGWVTTLFENLANRYIERVLPGVDAIITTTRSYAETSPVVSRFQYNPIPIGIHTKPWDDVRNAFTAEEGKRNPHRILFVGRLAANKGVEILVDALARIRRTVPQATLTIAGEGEEKERIIAQIEKLGLTSAVEWLGTMSFKDLVQLYSTSAVFVLPSINRLEAFGIVQLEAMTCGTPVVASDLPGVNGVMDVGKTGLLFPIGNSEALAQTLLGLLQNPARIESMGRAARELIERKYGWKTIIDNIEGIYQKAIQNFQKKIK